MSLAKYIAAHPKRRAVFLLIACLSLGFLGGCGGGWQPDRQDQTRPSGEGSGIYAPTTQEPKIDL